MFLTIHGSSQKVQSFEWRRGLLCLCPRLQETQNGLKVLFLSACGCDLGQGGFLLLAHLFKLSKRRREVKKHMLPPCSQQQQQQEALLPHTTLSREATAPWSSITLVMCCSRADLVAVGRVASSCSCLLMGSSSATGNWEIKHQGESFFTHKQKAKCFVCRRATTEHYPVWAETAPTIIKFASNETSFISKVLSKNSM